MQRIQREGYPVPVSGEFIDILEKEITASNHKGGCLILNFRDPTYSAERGGFHPIEVMISKGVICYITDFAYVGAPPFEELAKQIDFDFKHHVFQQMGRDQRIAKGVGLYRIWEANFNSYYQMGVYQTEVSSC